MTRDQKSLLLYLETRLVDHYGRVELRHMNSDDMDQATKWSNEGFIGFGRIVFDDCNQFGSSWVTFSDDAWEEAHRARRARAENLLERRGYRRTSEKETGQLVRSM